MNISSRRRRLLAIRACAAAALGIALFLGSSAAQAQNERLYIKHNGKIAVALLWDGEVLSRSHEGPRLNDTAGLQIKNAGTVIVNIGPDDPSNPERLGTFNAPNSGSPFAAVRENWFAIFSHPGTLRIASQFGGAPRWEFDHVDKDFRTSDGHYAREFAFRKDFRDLTDWQKMRFTSLVNEMDSTFYPGTAGTWDTVSPRTAANNYQKPYSYFGASYWDKAAQMHQLQFYIVHDGHNFGYIFLPWHRQFVAWMEDLMRVSEPLFSMPYWNWETNPVMDSPPIISAPENGNSGWLGQADGRIGDPFFWLDNNDVLAGSFEEFDFDPVSPAFCGDGTGIDSRCDPSKPPYDLDRYVKYDYSPLNFFHDGEWMSVIPDADVLAHSDWDSMRVDLEANAHNHAHHYLCDHGEIHGPRSPMDPMFWLLHTNCDRVWAAWQKLDPTVRMAAATAYGSDDDATTSLLNSTGPSAGKIEPWGSGRMTTVETTPNPVGGPKLEPFDSATYQQNIKYKDAAILVPRLYK